MRTAILDALEARYEANILEADATLKIYLESSVGIGEHPQHIEEVDKLIDKISKHTQHLLQSLIAIMSVLIMVTIILDLC